MHIKSLLLNLLKQIISCRILSLFFLPISIQYYSVKIFWQKICEKKWKVIWKVVQFMEIHLNKQKKNLSDISEPFYQQNHPPLIVLLTPSFWLIYPSAIKKILPVFSITTFYN